MRGALCAAIFMVALSQAACGGSSTAPPPPAGPYTNASLSGQYAFSMSGLDLNGAYFARVGSFTADGAGNITAGLEDELNLSSGQAASMVSIASGTYQVQSNGRGQMILNASGGGQLKLSMVMQSTGGGFLVQTDLNEATSGTFSAQSATDFTNAALGHPYVFESAGVAFTNSNAAPLGLAGQIVADGNGNITGGVMDTNDGNLSAPSGATAVTASTYALDTSGNGTSYGRGTMTINGRAFAYYIVNAAHLMMLEEDTLGGSMGDALQQTGAIPAQNSQFTGSFVYMEGGAAVVGPEGPVAQVGRFTADGNGGIGSISLDYNNNGVYTHVSQGGNISTATYDIDAANAGSGRGTFTFKNSGTGTYGNVFYLISPTQAMVQVDTSGLVGNGPMSAQTGGPFSVSGSAGNYVSNWSGVQLGTSGAAPFQEDYVNQYTLSNASTGNISGAIDYVELGLTSTTFYSNVGLGGTLTIKNDSLANNLYKFAVNGSPSLTVNFQAYFVNPGTVYMICSDTTRTTAGVIHSQAQ